MKNLILFFALLISSFSYCLKAQESTTDYIYSSEGFEIKKGIVPGSFVYESTGLYSKDGKVLVAAISCKNKVFYVLEGCETICSKAFQYMNGTQIYIPSTVKNIAPDAIVSTKTTDTPNYFIGIDDNCNESSSVTTSSISQKKDSDASEIARYSIQGVKLDEPTTGINIVQLSDGSTEKVLVK